MNLDIQCNECEEKFRFQPLNQRVGKVLITYIECPHCKKRYLSYVQDEQIRYRLTKAKRMVDNLRDDNLNERKRRRLLEEKKEFDQQTKELIKEKETKYQAEIAQVLNPEE